MGILKKMIVVFALLVTLSVAHSKTSVASEDSDPKDILPALQAGESVKCENHFLTVKKVPDEERPPLQIEILLAFNPQNGKVDNLNKDQYGLYGLSKIICTDITNDGISELIVKAVEGRWLVTSIFSLKQGIKNLGDFANLRLEDLNGDGLKEIVSKSWDFGLIDGFPMAWHPYIPQVHCFKDDDYHECILDPKILSTLILQSKESVIKETQENPKTSKEDSFKRSLILRGSAIEYLVFSTFYGQKEESLNFLKDLLLPDDYQFILKALGEIEKGIESYLKSIP